MELQSQRITLRDFRPADFDALWEYESRPETHRFERGVPTEEDTRAKFARTLALAQESRREHYRMAMTIRPEDVARGHVSLQLNFVEIREWEIGWAVHYGYWGNGYASEAARTMLAFAFGELNAHRVVAFCNANNAASVRVMEKIGMRRDGLLRETRWWNGAWADEYVYAMLERDWKG
jgi:RimJ/RimL family protein N-acetyltransferase